MRLVLPRELEAAASPLTISLSSRGVPTWAKIWKRPFGRRLDAWATLEAHGLFAGQGSYLFRVVMPNGSSLEAEAELSGEEDAVGLTIRIEASKDAATPRVQSLELKRVLPPPPGVTLRRLWKPAADAHVAYELYNGSKAVLGDRALMRFSGSVERWEEDRWIESLRGGFCGTYGSGTALQPGASVVSTEGPFIGAPVPLTPSRYRYVLEYTSGAVEDEESAAVETGDTPKVKRLTVHRSIDEFETAWSPEWIRANGGTLPACEYHGALSSGRVRIATRGKERAAELFGIELESPPPDELLATLDLHGPIHGRPPPCEVREDGAIPKVRVLVPEAGDLADLAELVLISGHARVTSGDFAERTRYVEIERRVRSAPFGSTTIKSAGCLFPVNKSQPIRLGRGTPAFALLKGASAGTMLEIPAVGPKALAVARAKREGFTLEGFVDSSDIAFRWPRPKVLAGFLIPKSGSRLKWTGSAPGGLLLEFSPSADLQILPEAQLHPFRVDCDSLWLADDSQTSVNPGKIDADNLVAISGSAPKPAALRSGKPIPLARSPAGLAIASLSGNGSPSVSVIEQRRGQSRIVYESENVFVFGWVHSSDVILGGSAIDPNRPVGGSSMGLGGGWRSTPPPRSVHCQQDLELIAQIAGERRAVGSIAARTVFRVLPAEDELVEVVLPELLAELASHARIGVLASQLARCQQ